MYNYTSVLVLFLVPITCPTADVPFVFQGVTFVIGSFSNRLCARACCVLGVYSPTCILPLIPPTVPSIAPLHTHCLGWCVTPLSYSVPSLLLQQQQQRSSMAAFAYRKRKTLMCLSLYLFSGARLVLICSHSCLYSTSFIPGGGFAI